MEKWKHVTLGDVAELSGGYAFKSSQYTEQGRVVVRTINIRDDCSITLDGATYISEDDAAQFSKFSLRCMDTLFVMVAATLGKIGFVRSDVLPALLNQNMWIIRAKPGRIEPVFLHYCFRELSRIPLAWVSGSARSFLRRDDVRNLEFHLPPLTEQRAIAHILGTLDDKIELNRRMSETLEAMARALFKDWFVDFGPTRAKIEGRDPYLAPEIWDLFPDKLDADGKPEGWEVQSVIDQAEWVNGAAYRNMHFSNAPDALPVVKITELKAGVTENTKRTNTALADKYRISDREMLFAWSGNPDTSIDAFIWTGGNAWLNQHIFAVRDNGARTLAFLYIMLKLLKPEFSEIARNKQTTGLGHVTKQDLKRMRIHVGPTELVETFEHLVGPLHARMQGNLLENMTLANTRNLLLPKLISGEISIGHADKIVQEST